MAVQVVTDTDFQNEIKNNERVVVKYYADWCGSCRLLAPKFKKMSDDERFTGIKFLDINAETNPEARKWAGVTNLPFFAVVKSGELVVADCTSKEDKIAEMIEKIKM